MEPPYMEPVIEEEPPAPPPRPKSKAKAKPKAVHFPPEKAVKQKALIQRTAQYIPEPEPERMDPYTAMLMARQQQAMARQAAMLQPYAQMFASR